MQLGAHARAGAEPRAVRRERRDARPAAARSSSRSGCPGAARPGETVWLPIDAKFPLEDYQRLVEAQERADPEAAEAAARQLETRVKACAKDISDKYLNPPKTTDFAILFLPTEGLFAEVMRRPGLRRALQRDCRVVIAGPTTLWSMLNSLQMGFRTLAIQKRSSEVWQLLAAVKTEWSKYGEVLDKVQKKLHEASATIEKAQERTRVIGRKLKDVEELPGGRGRRGAAARGGGPRSRGGRGRRGGVTSARRRGPSSGRAVKSPGCDAPFRSGRGLFRQVLSRA